MPYLLQEGGISDTLICYIVLKKLITPFEDWDAFKNGIIDERGEKLKEPINFNDRKAWTVLDKFVWNLKKIMMQFVGKSQMAHMLTAVYLLRNSISPAILLQIKQGDHEELLSHMTHAKQKELFEIFTGMELPDLSFDKVNDLTLALEVAKHIKKIQKRYNKTVALKEDFINA